MLSPENAPLCVFCRRHPVDPVWRPFCSERCKIQDLARWADGRYTVAGENICDEPEPSNNENTQ